MRIPTLYGLSRWWERCGLLLSAGVAVGALIGFLCWWFWPRPTVCDIEGHIWDHLTYRSVPMRVCRVCLLTEYKGRVTHQWHTAPGWMVTWEMLHARR